LLAIPWAISSQTPLLASNVLPILDSVGGELKAIAALMAQGTHEQFERTDQVATAMIEMSATAQEVAHYAAQAVQAADGADRSS